MRVLIFSTTFVWNIFHSKKNWGRYDKNVYSYLYRVIHKSLRHFRPLRYSSRDGHVERGACQQRERHSKFLPYLTGARYVHPWWRGRCQSFNQVPATHVARMWQELDYRIDRIQAVGQKLGVSLPLLTCSPFGVTIPATVPQRSEIPEGLTNYPV